MILYLTATSKNNIGYVPDWLKVSYIENGQNLELTLDIVAEINYSKTKLKCRCKGDLIPWTLYNSVFGEEINLSEIPEEGLNDIFPVKKIIEIFQTGTDFRVGLYPVKNTDEVFKLADEDVLDNCKGLCMIYDDEIVYEKNFTFEIELNI